MGLQPRFGPARERALAPRFGSRGWVVGGAPVVSVS